MDSLSMLIFVPIILVLGTAGNLCSLFAFLHPNMRGLVPFRFLAYLAVIDMVFLLVGMPHIFVIFWQKYDFRNYSNAVCATHSFLTLFLSHLSSNVQAAVSVYRCIVMTRPTPIQRKNTLRGTSFS